MTPSRPSERPTATSAAPWLARLRLIAALALALLLLGIGRVLDLQQHLSVESLRATAYPALRNWPCPAKPRPFRRDPRAPWSARSGTRSIPSRAAECRARRTGR